MNSKKEEQKKCKKDESNANNNTIEWKKNEFKNIYREEIFIQSSDNLTFFFRFKK